MKVHYYFLSILCLLPCIIAQDGGEDWHPDQESKPPEQQTGDEYTCQQQSEYYDAEEVTTKPDQQGQKHESVCVFRGIKLNSTSYQWIPKAPHDHPGLIDHVRFEDCIIPVVTKNICEVFKTIKSLKIIGQGVEKVEENAFQECSVLNRLDLSDNLIEKVQRNTFSSLGNLEMLNLHHNRIEKLDCWFENLPGLVVLDISANNLTALSLDKLPRDSKLKVFRLNSNDLSDLEIENIIEHFLKLEEISFEDNEISCTRMVQIINKLDAANITHKSMKYEKVRYYTQHEIFQGYKCNPDIEWMAANYRKQKSIILSSLGQLHYKELETQSQLKSLWVTLNQQGKKMSQLLNDMNGKKRGH